MQNASDLKTQLQAIDRKSYPAYKSLKGSYQFSGISFFILTMYRGILLRHLHIFRIRLSHKTAGFPATYYKDTLTRVTLADYLTRQFEAQVSRYTFPCKRFGQKRSHLRQPLRTRSAFTFRLRNYGQRNHRAIFYWIPGKRAIPLMPQNWKKSSLIFSLSVLKRHFSIKTPITETWNRQSSLPRIRIQFAHS